MALRRPSFAVLWLAIVPVVLTPLPAAVLGDTPATVVDAQPYVGQVSGDDVLVRSGPSEAFYATQKLNKGDRLTVVGVRGADGDWLKIVPPPGSFCYVAQAYVDRSAGTDSAGRVKKPDLNVRAGSLLLPSARKTRLMTLNPGDAVQILGTADDYFKIAPPPGAYLYVQKSLVTAVPSAAAPAIPLVAQANDREPMASDPVVPARPTPAIAPAVPPAAVAPAVVAAVPPTPPVSRSGGTGHPDGPGPPCFAGR